MTIYRAVKNPKALEIGRFETPRAPSNIPFYVDNIWEWLRPVGFPSRRHSAFAAPTKQLAAKAINCSIDNVYEVELARDAIACQIVRSENPEDAKFHPDLKRLRELVIGRLPSSWFQSDLTERFKIGALFLPCCPPEQVDTLMRDCKILKQDEIRRATTIWKDVEIISPMELTSNMHESGEIFFEGGYRLKKISQV